MLIQTSFRPKFFRRASMALLVVCAWISISTSALAQQRTDSAIQSNVASAFQQDSSLQGQHITATANKGIVTLTGTVQTQAQSQQAETDAANVTGVSGILNQIKVESPSKTAPDAGIAAQTSANQLSPENNDNQDQAQNQPQNESTVPPPPPDETQPQQAEQPQQPYPDQGTPPPPPPGYGAPPQQAYEPPRQVPYYNTPTQ